MAFALWLGAILTAVPGPAQQEPAGLTRFAAPSRYPEQYRAATELADQLGATAADPETLYQLSRLLSEPCDQVLWLGDQLTRLGRFGTDAATRQAAENVLARLNELDAEGAEWLRGCREELVALLEQLERIARPPTPWEIEESAQLAETWRSLDPAHNADLQRELTPARRLLLNARGIAPAELNLTGRETWDVPRKVVELLAERSELPPMTRLIQLHDALERARADEAAWQNIEFPVNDTYAVARALLDRALGIDALDHSGSATSPDWNALAGRFENRNYWTWASLARLLEAAATGSNAPATDAARAQWAKAQQVAEALNAPIWPAVAEAPGAWLERLTGGAALNQADMLPLSADYRAARRATRRTYEDRFLESLNNVDEAFRNIQLAKAADIGRDPATYPTATLNQIEADLQYRKLGQVAGLNVFALVEMIAIQRSGGPRQYYAVLVNIDGWTWTSTTYQKRVVGPSSSPAELIRSSFDDKYKELRDVRLLIAFDGLPDATWFEFERASLWPYASLQPPSGRGWLAYLPSLAAFQPGNWTIEDSIRHFFIGALSAGETLGVYTNERSAGPYDVVAPKSIPDFLEKAPSFSLHALSTGPFPASLNAQRANGFARRLYTERTGTSGQPHVFLLFTSKPTE